MTKATSATGATQPTEARLAFARRLRRGLLFVAVAGVTAFVLLPIVWMVITALKQQGQALKFDFVPQTTVRSRAYGFEVGGAPVVILEYRDPVAQQVAVSGELTH